MDQVARISRWLRNLGLHRRRTSRQTRALLCPFEAPLVHTFKADVELHLRTSVLELSRENLKPLNRTLPFLRLYMLVKCIASKDADFPAQIHERLTSAVRNCAENSHVKDNLSGLYLSLDAAYALLVLEGNDDMVGDFLAQLITFSADYWAADCMFVMEDICGETYFDLFYCRFAAAVHVRQQIPDYAPDDAEIQLMIHQRVQKKLQLVCGYLGAQFREVMTPQVPPKSMASAEPITILAPAIVLEPLSPEEYNQFLPEVEDLEFLLCCKGRYFSIAQYAQLYDDTPLILDSDSTTWPQTSNYLPTGLFDITEFDVNLSYGDSFADALSALRKEDRLFPPELDVDSDEEDEEITKGALAILNKGKKMEETEEILSE